MRKMQHWKRFKISNNELRLINNLELEDMAMSYPDTSIKFVRTAS